MDIGVYALSFVRWFMTEKPNQVLSQVKLATTGVDEQVGILLSNDAGEMATIALTLHAKQPKRGLLPTIRATSSFTSTHVVRKQSLPILKTVAKR